MKRFLGKFLTVCTMIAVLLIACLEIRPYQVHHSQIFSTSQQTEIRLYVVINTLMGVDEEKLAVEIISENQRVNGIRENSVYTLNLYRTGFHYRRNWEYDTIICDENGAIICCGEDLGV